MCELELSRIIPIMVYLASIACDHSFIGLSDIIMMIHVIIIFMEIINPCGVMEKTTNRDIL